jgi:hypothetical protein
MGYLDILKSSKEEANHTPQEVIRAELSKKFPPDVRKIYAENLYELCSLRSASNWRIRWFSAHGDDLCEYVRYAHQRLRLMAGIDYDNIFDENIANKVRYVALLAAKKGVCFK